MKKQVTIQNDILAKIATAFLNSDIEEGFLLGCSSQLDQITASEHLPSACAGKHFYRPDSTTANQIIRQWSAQGICFCGFIHSHVVDKQDLSDADIDFAQCLFNTFNLPVLWFGIGIINRADIQYRFYSITGAREDTFIETVEMRVIETS